MISLTYPAYVAVSQRAKATKDMSNLRQIGIGMQTYLNDKDQILPVSVTWPGTTATPVLYPKYVSSRRVFQSPFDPRPSSESDVTPASVPISYSINTKMYLTTGLNGNMSRVVSPSSTILMAPNYPAGSGNPAVAASWPGNATNAPDLPLGGAGEARGTHLAGTKINVLFCDLHTETLTFGPATTAGTFQDTTSNSLGLKHWDPLQ
jgi:hypothetical protein